jgi:hypothetical protein
VEVGKCVGFQRRQFAIEFVKAMESFVICRIDPYEIKVLRFIYEELPEPFAADKDETV